jgi:hypothetical protein
MVTSIVPTSLGRMTSGDILYPVMMTVGSVEAAQVPGIRRKKRVIDRMIKKKSLSGIRGIYLISTGIYLNVGR